VPRGVSIDPCRVRRLWRTLVESRQGVTEQDTLEDVVDLLDQWLTTVVAGVAATERYEAGQFGGFTDAHGQEEIGDVFAALATDDHRRCIR